MNLKKRVVVPIFTLALMMIAVTAFQPRIIGAQSNDAPSVPPVAIAQGPGGMWIVRGDKVYVCRLPLVGGPSVFTPQCSSPTKIP